MKRLTLAILVVCTQLTQSAIGQQTDPPKATAAEPAKVSKAEAKVAEELFQAGRKLFFQGKFNEAAQKLRQATDKNPGKTGYKLLLAKAYRFANQEKQAVTVLNEILQSDPEHVAAGVELAELLSPRKQPDRVIAVLEPLLKFKHDYPLYHLLAEAHYEKEDYNKARTYYLEATKLNPDSAGDHYQLGNIFLAQKRFAKAAQSYEKAEQLGFSSGVFHFKLASVYFNLHRYLGKVTKAQVVGGKPGEIKSNMYLIDPVPGQKDTFYVAGNRSAVFQVAKAQKEGIDIFDIHFLEANIWLSARRYANANKIYGRLEDKVRPEDAGLFWYHWAQSALELGQYDAYLKRLMKAAEAEPDVYKSTLSDAYLIVANRYNSRGDRDRYVEFLVKAVNVNPLSARLHRTLGDAYWLAGKNSEAVAQYKLVLELEPDHPSRVQLLNRIRKTGDRGD